MTAILKEIWRYPVKSLNGELLESISVEADKRLPEDRRFAIVKGGGSVEPGVTAWASKRSFFNLMSDEKLATLRVSFNPDDGMMTLERGGRQVARGQATEPLGRMLIDQFLGAFLAGEGASPKLVESAGAAFTDVEPPFISLINLASVADLGRVLGQEADPRRFRGNLLLEGLKPWEERDWVGKRFSCGEVELEVVEPINRCAATEVDPDKGIRDLPVLKSLSRGFAHLEMGVYALITKGGRLKAGAPLERIV
ncbi:MOSC domain-containing protein [Limibacillus halophilus]